MTLECRSEILFDTFILSSKREEIIKLKHSAESHLGGSHANFSIGPVTPDHAGTYTCYGSYNHNPYEWSHSSDPVDIKITGKRMLSALHSFCDTKHLFCKLKVLGDHEED